MRKLIVVLIVLTSLVSVASTLRHFHIHQSSYDSFTVTCDGGKAITSEKDGVLTVTCK